MKSPDEEQILKELETAICPVCKKPFAKKNERMVRINSVDEPDKWQWFHTRCVGPTSH